MPTDNSIAFNYIKDENVFKLTNVLLNKDDCTNPNVWQLTTTKCQTNQNTRKELVLVVTHSFPYDAINPVKINDTFKKVIQKILSSWKTWMKRGNFPLIQTVLLWIIAYNQLPFTPRISQSACQTSKDHVEKSDKILQTWVISFAFCP